MLTRVLFLAVFGFGLAGVAGAAQPRPATGEELVLMMEAIEKTARELPRWAYTETRIMRDEKGKVKRSEVVRYDPSLPYAEQWVPVSVNGKPPTTRDREKYRRQGLRTQERDEKAENKENVGGGKGDITLDRGAMRRPVTLGEVLVTHGAKVVSSDARTIVFDIPLRKDRNERFPPEKFQVLARISKDTRALENIAVNLRESFRTKLVVKVKSGEGTLDFAVVDPKHAPTLTQIRGDASASVFFVSVGGEFELKRTELKAVKPYAERFEVQVGTIQALDF
jgi:hypothetical protein